jgi:excisionase family DNA binding protein
LLVDLAELAVLLKISARTAKRMAAAGELPGLVRLGRLVRFDRRVIERWIADGCPKPTARRGGRR